MQEPVRGVGFRHSGDTRIAAACAGLRGVQHTRAVALGTLCDVVIRQPPQLLRLYAVLAHQPI